MSNRLDQLFKNKLSNHALAPSAHAWDRVKNGLVKKNNRLLLFRMAAAVLLVAALATALLWLSSKNQLSNSSILSKKTESKTNTVKPITSSPQPVNVGKQISAGQPVSKNAKQVTVPIDKDNEKVHTLIKDQDNVAQTTIRTDEQRQSLASSDPVTPVASHLKEEKPIVLEYRLETIEPQHVVQFAAAQEPKGKSGLLKVIDFARDAKNGDGRLGDLRQAKDELFALNFKKDKQNNHK